MLSASPPAVAAPAGARVASAHAGPPRQVGPALSEPAAAETIAIVVAAGRGGRNMISCDDGRTWILDRVETAPSARCWGQPDAAIPRFLDPEQRHPNPDWLECDHHPGHTTSLVYHDGWFVKTLGWGTPGRTLRSRDGVDWIAPRPEFDATYMGLLALGDELVALGTPEPLVSRDHGASWRSTGRADYAGSIVRSAGQAGGPDGGVVFVTDRGLGWGDRELRIFGGPLPLPCGEPLGFAHDQRTTLLACSDGSIVSSADAGRTWSRRRLGRKLSTNPLWDRQLFRVWGEDEHGVASQFSSADAATWLAAPIEARGSAREPNNEAIRLSRVGVTVRGTFVATNEAWNGGYERQRFYRSEDGLAWQTLPSGAFRPGHPISAFAAGEVPANLYCAQVTPRAP
jgi:hypothetical protein